MFQVDSVRPARNKFGEVVMQIGKELSCPKHNKRNLGNVAIEYIHVNIQSSSQKKVAIFFSSYK